MYTNVHLQCNDQFDATDLGVPTRTLAKIASDMPPVAPTLKKLKKNGVQGDSPSAPKPTGPTSDKQGPVDAKKGADKLKRRTINESIKNGYLNSAEADHIGNVKGGGKQLKKIQQRLEGEVNIKNKIDEKNSGVDNSHPGEGDSDAFGDNTNNGKAKFQRKYDGLWDAVNSGMTAEEIKADPKLSKHLDELTLAQKQLHRYRGVIEGQNAIDDARTAKDPKNSEYLTDEQHAANDRMLENVTLSIDWQRDLLDAIDPEIGKAIDEDLKSNDTYHLYEDTAGIGQHNEAGKELDHEGRVLDPENGPPAGHGALEGESDKKLRARVAEALKNGKLNGAEKDLIAYAEDRGALGPDGATVADFVEQMETSPSYPGTTAEFDSVLETIDTNNGDDTQFNEGTRHKDLYDKIVAGDGTRADTDALYATIQDQRAYRGLLEYQLEHYDESSGDYRDTQALIANIDATIAKEMDAIGNEEADGAGTIYSQLDHDTQQSNDRLHVYETGQAEAPRGATLDVAGVVIPDVPPGNGGAGDQAGQGGNDLSDKEIKQLQNSGYLPTGQNGGGEITFNDKNEAVYTVQPGDSYWSIAQGLNGGQIDQSQWEHIVASNAETLGNPTTDLIYAGQQIVIPGLTQAQLRELIGN